MRAVVVYESMYGNTHAVAEAIGQGLGDAHEVAVVPVHEAGADLVANAELLVVGGPTHAHGASRPSTRKAAVEAGEKPGSELAVDPDAQGPGVREWLASLAPLQVKGAAFDTRIHAPAVLTGRASHLISKELRRHGVTEVAQPESFFVDKDSHLARGEEERAREWGQRLAAAAGS